MDSHKPIGAPTLIVGAFVVAVGFAAWGLAQPIQAPAAIWGLLSVLAVTLVAAGLWAGRATRAEVALREAEPERQAVRERAEAVERSWQSLAEGVDGSVFLCDEAHGVLYANRRARAFFRTEHPVGRPLLTITISDAIDSLLDRCLESGDPQSGEVMLGDHDDRVLHVRAWPLDGPERQAFVVATDVTEFKRLERARRDFVANVSHELRTPMTAIRAMAESLVDASPDEQELYARFLGRIIHEVDRLSKTAEDLLTLAAAEAKPADTAPCNLAELARAVTMQLTPQAVNRELVIECHAPESVVVRANSGQVTQVLVNLVANAIAYTPKGRIDVCVEESPQDVRIKVKDTGIGIASENQPRVFERFFRVDKARSREGGGTGLGLSIVKHIVESHGGSVSVESTLGRGSTFTVTLPRSEGTPTADEG